MEIDIIQKLPILVKEELFMQLPGGNLHKCRQVCKAWNQFIKYLWTQKKAKDFFSMHLDSNWRFPLYRNALMKYKMNMDYVVMPFMGYIENASMENLVLRTPKETEFDESRVAIYNVSAKRWLEIADINTDLNGIADVSENFEVLVTETLLIIRVAMMGATKRSLIRVWKLETQQLLYEGIVRKVDFMFVNELESPNVLIIFTTDSKKELQVFNFNKPGCVNISVKASTNHEESFGSYHKPYILQNMYDEENDRKIVIIWKYNEEDSNLSFYMRIDDIEEFVDYPKELGYIRGIAECLFVNDHFLLTAKMIFHEFISEGKFYYHYADAILVVDNEGGVMHQHIFLHQRHDVEIDLFIFQDKVLFEMNNSVYIFEKTLKKMCKWLTRREYDDPTYDIMKFTHMPHLAGTDILMLSTFEARKVEVVTIGDSNQPRIKVKRLNFWNKAGVITISNVKQTKRVD